MRFHIYATVSGGKYLGIVEAATAEEAVEKAYDLDSACVSLCHQCSRDMEDAEITDVTAEPAD